MKITSILRCGVAALAMGAFFGASLPGKADRLVLRSSSLHGQRSACMWRWENVALDVLELIMPNALGIVRYIFDL